MLEHPGVFPLGSFRGVLYPASIHIMWTSEALFHICDVFGVPFMNSPTFLTAAIECQPTIIKNAAGRTSLSCVAGALIRLGLDQLLWAPVFISTFLASLLTLEVCLCRLRFSIGHALMLLSHPGPLGVACSMPCSALLLL